MAGRGEGEYHEDNAVDSLEREFDGTEHKPANGEFFMNKMNLVDENFFSAGRWEMT